MHRYQTVQNINYVTLQLASICVTGVLRSSAICKVMNNNLYIYIYIYWQYLMGKILTDGI